MVVRSLREQLKAQEALVAEARRLKEQATYATGRRPRPQQLASGAQPSPHAAARKHLLVVRPGLFASQLRASARPWCKSVAAAQEPAFLHTHANTCSQVPYPRPRPPQECARAA